MTRRTQVTATIFDAEGYPFVSLRGNPQDIGDALAVYVLNVAEPLTGQSPLIELIESREEEES